MPSSLLRTVRSAALVAAVVAGSLALGSVPANASGKTSAGGDYRRHRRRHHLRPRTPARASSSAGSPPASDPGAGRQQRLRHRRRDPRRLRLHADRRPGHAAHGDAADRRVRLEGADADRGAARRRDDQEPRGQGRHVVCSSRPRPGKFKIQAKDGAQGGIFQMESEFGAPVEFVHTLGPGLFYFVNQFTGKVNFGDGVDAVTSGGRGAPDAARQGQPAGRDEDLPERHGHQVARARRAAASAACSARTRSSCQRRRHELHEPVPGAEPDPRLAAGAAEPGRPDPDRRLSPKPRPHDARRRVAVLPPGPTTRCGGRRPVGRACAGLSPSRRSRPARATSRTPVRRARRRSAAAGRCSRRRAGSAPSGGSCRPPGRLRPPRAGPR